MFLATCLAKVTEEDWNGLKGVLLLADRTKHCETSCMRVLHCAMLQKSVAALPQSLRKVELDSTSCNACCSKNVARLDDCGICYTMQFLVQFVSQQNCETKIA